MLAAEPYPDLFAAVALPKNELLEIHRNKISLHRAKADYSYPTIRLPHTFSKLAGLPARIYQTVHKGVLAFLVVVGPGGAAIEKSAERSENACSCAKSPALTWRRSPVRIRPSPSFFCFFWPIKPHFGHESVCVTFTINLSDLAKLAKCDATKNP